MFDIIDKESYDKYCQDFRMNFNPKFRHILVKFKTSSALCWLFPELHFWGNHRCYTISLETDNPTIFKSKRIKDYTLNRRYNYIHIVLRKIIVNRYRCLWTTFYSHVYDGFLPSFSSQILQTKLNIVAWVLRFTTKGSKKGPLTTNPQTQFLEELCSKEDIRSWYLTIYIRHVKACVT